MLRDASLRPEVPIVLTDNNVIAKPKNLKLEINDPLRGLQKVVISLGYASY